MTQVSAFEGSTAHHLVVALKELAATGSPRSIVFDVHNDSDVVVSAAVGVAGAFGRKARHCFFVIDCSALESINDSPA